MLTMPMNNGSGAPREWTSDWTTWAPRAEISPSHSVDPAGGRNGLPALRMEGHGDSASWGAWRRKIDGITGGRTYRFTAYYRSHGIAHPQMSISPRITWL